MRESGSPFERLAEEYDAWFDRHADLFRAEREAIASLFPSAGRGLEIGAGTGRFAASFGVRFGVDPSPAMAAAARERGVVAAVGLGEALPFRSGAFDRALLVTVLCFAADPDALLAETARVLRPGGTLVAALLDRDSPSGRRREEAKAGHPFYRNARFLSARETIASFQAAPFRVEAVRQTLFDDPGKEKEIREGHGEGGFVVLAARRDQGRVPSGRSS